MTQADERVQVQIFVKDAMTPAWQNLGHPGTDAEADAQLAYHAQHDAIPPTQHHRYEYRKVPVGSKEHIEGVATRPIRSE